MRAMKWIGLTVLVLCAGCGGLGKYADERGNDFLDCFTAQAGIGGWVPAFELHATDWVTTGAGYTYSFKWGLEGRHAVQRTYLQGGALALPLGVVFPDVGLDLDPKKEGALRFLYTYGSYTNKPSSGFLGIFGSPHKLRKSILFFDTTSLPGLAYHPTERGGGGRFVQEERPLVQALDMHVDVTPALWLGPSFRFGFSPGQFADFLLGFFGLDIAEDD